MAGKIYTRSKMQNLGEVFLGLYDDLKDAGFAQILPAASTRPTITQGAGTFVFESTATVNPLHETQPYRILVVLSGASAQQGQIKIAVANPQQISNTGQVSAYPGPTDPHGIRTMGQLGSAWNRSTGSQMGDTFINRGASNVIYTSGTTVSSILVATNRGVFYEVWEEGVEDNPNFSMFCVQLPVDKDTGAPLLTDKSPIFCVYNCGNTGFKKFIVNESDVATPSRSVTAEVNTQNSNAIINAKDQVSIARGNKYLVTLPNRLNTDRFAYTQELDMFAYVSADVIGEGNDISVTLYGESTPRVYRALKATGPDNTKVRLLALIENGGVPAE